MNEQQAPKIKPEKQEKVQSAEASPQIRPSRRERLAQEAGEPDKLSGVRDLIAKPEDKKPPGDDDENEEEDLEEAKKKDDTEEKGTDGEEDDDPERFKCEGATLKDVAEKLGITAKELYAISVPIPVGQGVSATIGELKDFARNYLPRVERMNNLDKLEVQHRAERAETIRDLDNLTSLLPKEAFTKEYIEAAKQKASNIARSETQRLIAACPELGDPATFNSTRVAMVDVAARYGLTDDDVSNIIDHRWLLALRDLAQLSAMKEGAAALKPNTSKNRESRPIVTKAASAKDIAQRELFKKAKAGDKQAQTRAVLSILSRGQGDG